MNILKRLMILGGIGTSLLTLSGCDEALMGSTGAVNRHYNYHTYESYHSPRVAYRQSFLDFDDDFGFEAYPYYSAESALYKMDRDRMKRERKRLERETRYARSERDRVRLEAERARLERERVQLQREHEQLAYQNQRRNDEYYQQNQQQYRHADRARVHRRNHTPSRSERERQIAQDRELAKRLQAEEIMNALQY